MKRISAKYFVITICSLFLVSACQNPVATNSSGDNSNYVPPGFITSAYSDLNFVYESTTVYCPGSISLFSRVEDFNSNHELIGYEDFNYPDTFDMDTERGTFTSVIKSVSEDPDVPDVEEMRTTTTITDTYLYYTVVDSETNETVYAYYEKYDGNLNVIEVCAFDPSDGNKVSYYEKCDYTSGGGLGKFTDDLPDGKVIYYPVNLTASVSAGVLTVTGEKKILSEDYNVFDANKRILRQYASDYRYDKAGAFVRKEACLYNYIWAEGNQDTYWYAREFNYDPTVNYQNAQGFSADTGYKSNIKGDATVSILVDVKTYGDQQYVTSSYISPDGWTQSQEVMILESLSFGGGKVAYEKSTIAIDDNKNIKNSTTAICHKEEKNGQEILYYTEVVESPVSSSNDSDDNSSFDFNAAKFSLKIHR